MKAGETIDPSIDNWGQNGVIEMRIDNKQIAR